MVCESMVENLTEGSLLNTVKNNQFTSPDNYAPKVRKPYTIKKQRERWTEEEHKKFLEALRLHGRAWRQIEEHVGTKTAVQIRSHAQKFFSKVVRESTSGDVSEVKPIEIPPPRPKRKPMHPYPRKLSCPLKTEGQHERSTSPNSSGSDQDNESPTSVLSVGVSNIFGLRDSGSPNTGSSPISSTNGEEKESSLDIGSTQSLKLFGKTVVVSETRISDTVHPCEGNIVTLVPQNFAPVYYMQFLDECSGSSTSMSPWWGQHGGVFYPVVQPVRPTKESGLELQNEGSLNACDTDSEVKEEGKKAFVLVASERSAFRKQYRGDNKKKDACIKGFVPYTRCIEQMEVDSSGEEREVQRLRLNL